MSEVAVEMVEGASAAVSGHGAEGTVVEQELEDSSEAGPGAWDAPVVADMDTSEEHNAVGTGASSGPYAEDSMADSRAGTSCAEVPERRSHHAAAMEAA